MFEDWNTLQSRTQDWLLLESPTKITITCTAYLIFVFYAGPKFMKNKPAYSLRYLIMGYNMFQIAASYYLAKEFFVNGVSFRDAYQCHPPDYSGESQNITRSRLMHYTFLLKIVELIETIFFVLRKKQNQISTLHVYHHISTLYITYFGAKYVGCGLGCICIVLNLIVHFFMYLYYLLSSFGNENWHRKLLFYKIAITKFQIVQFLIMAVHAFIMAKNCYIDPINLVGFSFVFPDILLLLHMFVKFYIQSYNNKPKSMLTELNSATKKVI